MPTRWTPKKKGHSELAEILGEDIVSWAESVAGLYDELEPDNGEARMDDLPAEPSAPPPPPRKEARYRRKEDKVLMVCIICGSELTVDGRYCARHAD